MSVCVCVRSIGMTKSGRLLQGCRSPLIRSHHSPWMRQPTSPTTPLMWCGHSQSQTDLPFQKQISVCKFFSRLFLTKRVQICILSHQKIFVNRFSHKSNSIIISLQQWLPCLDKILTATSAAWMGNDHRYKTTKETFLYLHLMDIEYKLIKGGTLLQSPLKTSVNMIRLLCADRTQWSENPKMWKSTNSFRLIQNM